jgi:hypothetical protein
MQRIIAGSGLPDIILLIPTEAKEVRFTPARWGVPPLIGAGPG